MGRFRPFVRPGDRVFDIGAHRGDYTKAFRELGASVVAIEPQPRCIAELEERFSDDADVTVEHTAVGAEPGRETMWLGTATSISTLSDEWRQAVSESDRFNGQQWQETTEVEVTTLDRLIAAHGKPDFCKIDVEGYEPQVLHGLSEPIRALCFEWTPEHKGAGRRCVEALSELGEYEYNLVVFDGQGFQCRSWQPPDAILPFVPPEGANVFARLAS